jgi:DNA polymerase-3 subunit delta
MTRTASPRGLRPHELRAALKTPPPAPLYLCLGEEPHLAAQALELLRTAVVGPEPDVFNSDRFTAGETPAAGIVNAAGTLPAFAERRLVVITHAEAFGAADQAILTEYVNAPSPTTCMVVIAAKADQRQRFFAALMKQAVLINCHPLYERELPKWLDHQTASIGLRLTPEAAHALIEQTGSSLESLINELEKLRAYASARANALAQPGGDAPLPLTPPSPTRERSLVDAPVTLDELQAVSAGARERSVFELTDAVGERRAVAALTILRRLFEQGEYPVPVTTMLTRHMRRLRIAKSHLHAGAAVGALASLLAVMPRYAETLGRQAGGFTEEQLERALSRCLVADAQLKGGRLQKERVVEFLVIELCRGLPGPLTVTPA